MDIEQNKAYSNIALNCFISENPNCNGAFIRELVYGVLRNQFLLDYNITRFAKSVKVADRVLLRLGLYQICFMNSVSDYAAVNETVNLSKHNKNFINAVLRNFIREGKELKYDSWITQYSCHESIIALLKNAYGKEQTEFILKHSLITPRLTERVNKNGTVSIQGKSSQKAVETLDPRKGERLIDLCAAPGGKSFYAASLMDYQGEILAFDIYEHRVKLIEKEAKRIGIDIIKTGINDATVLNESLIDYADAVICDVPCSGLGTIAKKPEIKLKGLSSELSELYKIQEAILKNAALYVKRDGRLLYSTCTINPAENDHQIEKFLDNNKNYDLISKEQIFPHEDYDGFYIALMKRIN